jgi:hypothetical protein
MDVDDDTVEEYYPTLSEDLRDIFISSGVLSIVLISYQVWIPLLTRVIVVSVDLVSYIE